MGVCLNMIVRDEAAVIARCLVSVRPFIDCWCIVDTGSVDETREVVREALAGLPGELLERPWRQQDENRNEALDAARLHAEYVLLIDADEVLLWEPGFVLPKLTAPAYEITVRYGGLEFARTMLVRSDVPWRWIGRRHPCLRTEHPMERVHLAGICNVPRTDGASWRDERKYHKHAQELREDLAADPRNPRLLYYLAQSHRDAGELGQALEVYLARAEHVDGWAEETWSALYEAAKLIERLHKPYDEVVMGYLRAYRSRPKRAEPLYALARYLYHRGDYALAMVFATEAARKPRPPDRLFVEWAVYANAAAALLDLLRDALGESQTESAESIRRIDHADPRSSAAHPV